MTDIKVLAQNSILESGLPDEEIDELYAAWEEQWEAFITKWFQKSKEADVPALSAHTILQRPFAQTPKKVIFDTDMGYINDDAVAMIMLAQADKKGDLDLLGVTTVGGNVYAAPATTATLRQLELIDRTDIPVYEGTDVPLNGFLDMKAAEKIFGAPDWAGAYWDFNTNDYSDNDSRPTNYMDLGYEPTYGYPQTPVQEQKAWDFMIEQVHKYPGEVTIMAVGAATNVAIAIREDPTFVEDAAGIIYMGGDIDIPGNATPTAEFNWFYDPTAIKTCLAAEWKSQIVVPDDLARQCSMDAEIFERIRATGSESKATQLILEKEKSFDPIQINYVWDMVVPAVFLKPELVTDLQTRYLTVDDYPGVNYGRAVSWGQNRHNNLETGEGMPDGVQPVQIVMSIDEKMFWDYYIEILTWEPADQAQ